MKEIKEWYTDFCKRTKRGGSVLIGSSISELLEAFEKDMNRLEAVKNDVAQFSDEKFGADRSFKAPLHHLKQEVDEVIAEENNECKSSLGEFADCLLLLLDAFRKRHRDLTTDDLLRACENKMKINRKREWGNPDGNGVINHIR